MVKKIFFDKYNITQDESHAFKHIGKALCRAKKLYKKGKDYEPALKEVYEMIADFLEATS